MAHYIIYGLIDPITKQLRYVGKSSSGMKRVWEHGFKSINSREFTHKANWIRSLKSSGADFEVEVLETQDSPDFLYDAEQWYIQYFRSIGCDLTNHTDGGPGRLGTSPSIVTRGKISQKLKGHPANEGSGRPKGTVEKVVVDQEGNLFKGLRSVAQMLGVSESHISHILAGRRPNKFGLRVVSYGN